MFPDVSSRRSTHAGLKAARARGRMGGRPKALTAAQAIEVRALLRDPEVRPSEAKLNGVGRTTIYKYGRNA